MNEKIYREAIKKSSDAFAYHRAVFDDNNNMIDYIFLDVNESFEILTGLKKENIVNKRFVRDVAQDKENAMKWVYRYEEVLIEKSMIEFEEYSKEFKRYFSIKAYVSEKNHFVTLFSNITFEKKINEIATYFVDNMGNDIDYDKITEFAYDVSGSDYVAFNLFDKNGRDFTTVSICGIPDNITKALNILGIDLVNKKWTYDPVRENKIKDQYITYFDNLCDLTGDVIPKAIVKQLEKTFNLGKVVIVKISKDSKVIGDFTFLLKKGKELGNLDLLMLFMSQLGLFIEKTRLEKSLTESQKRFYALAEYAPVGFMSCNVKGEILYVNRKILEILESPSHEATKSYNLLELPPLKERGFSNKLLECMEKDREIIYEMGYESMWGKNSWLRVHYSPNKENDEVTGANIVVDDITDKKIKEDDLKEMAHRDPLTRAYNRNALESILLERINEANDNNLVSCVAIVDVDDFKNINDSYGHRIGDSVLKYLAARVKHELREQDLIIRTGGDEFLIYLHNIKNKEATAHFIKRIFKKISSGYRFVEDEASESMSLDVSCSIGCSFFPEDGKTVEELMAKADISLYKVKNCCKANYHIDL